MNRARFAAPPLIRRLLAAFVALALAAPFSVALADETHIVQPGETVSGIADFYGVSLASIEGYNGLKNIDLIVAGSKLVIPTRGEAGGAGASGASTTVQYRVEAGDNLSHIAQKFGATVREIVSLNDLADEDHIVEGELLAVPSRALAMQGDLRPADARQMLVDAAAEFGIVPELVLALAWQESGWQQHLVSSAGAIGVMQVLPSTANWAVTDLGVRNAEDWRTNPRSNIRVGVAILSALIDQAGGNGDMALAFYVQGWYSVEKNGWFDETKAYVNSVNALRAWYR